MPTYADRLAEFVRVTGHKPGEMNKRLDASGVPLRDAVDQLATLMVSTPYPKPDGAGWSVEVVSEGPPKRTLAEILADPPVLGLEPPAQSSGPGRCNRFTRAVLVGDPKPCKLPSNHEGPHEP